MCPLFGGGYCFADVSDIAVKCFAYSCEDVGGDVPITPVLGDDCRGQACLAA